MECKASDQRLSTAERCSLHLDYLSLCFDQLLMVKLTWGEGDRKRSFHRLPVRGEWPCSVNQSAQQTQSCLMGVHLLHWQPALHWGKERTRRLPHLLTLMETGGWGQNTEQEKEEEGGIVGVGMTVGAENLYPRWGAEAAWLKRPNVQDKRCWGAGKFFLPVESSLGWGSVSTLSISHIVHIQ